MEVSFARKIRNHLFLWSMASILSHVWWHQMYWLVVSIPLKNISQLGWLIQTYGKIKNVPNHQPVITRSMYTTYTTFLSVLQSLSDQDSSPRGGREYSGHLAGSGRRRVSTGTSSGYNAQMLHGAGIFNYKTGWFWGPMYHIWLYLYLCFISISVSISISMYICYITFVWNHCAINRKTST